MCCSVAGRVLPQRFEWPWCLNFQGRGLLGLKLKALSALKISRTTRSKTKHHVPEFLSLLKRSVLSQAQPKFVNFLNSELSN
jgi:hypothetical protein